MSYTQTLIAFSEKDECPGCGPGMMDVEEAGCNGNLQQKFCRCCGWMVTKIYGSYSFSSAVTLHQEHSFRCIVEYPEHLANWPQPPKQAKQEDEYTREELLQEIAEKDPNHYYLLDRIPVCGRCKQWAAHRIREETRSYSKEPASSALCCGCFTVIFGQGSHDYPYVYASPINEDLE